MVSAGCIFKKIPDFSIIIFVFYVAKNVTGFPQRSSCPADQARLNPGGQCFQLNTQGPCGQNMVFLPGGDGGECHCQDIVNPTLCSSRPVVKAADDFTRCYPLYQKGPCQSGQWLVPRPDGVAMGVCRKNSCQGTPASKLQGPGFVFVYQGMCYKTGTQGFCKPGEIALFDEGSRVPACFGQKTNGACSKTETNKLMTKTILPPSQIECSSGYTRSDDGDCSPIAQL